MASGPVYYTRVPLYGNSPPLLGAGAPKPPSLTENVAGNPRIRSGRRASPAAPHSAAARISSCSLRSQRDRVCFFRNSAGIPAGCRGLGAIQGYLAVLRLYVTNLAVYNCTALDPSFGTDSRLSRNISRDRPGGCTARVTDTHDGLKMGSSKTD